MTKKLVTLEDLDEEFRKAAKGRTYKVILALLDAFIVKAVSLELIDSSNWGKDIESDIIGCIGMGREF